MTDSERKIYLRELGERIKNLRTSQNMSLDELAKKCGYETENARSSMSKIESGKTDVGASKLKMIASALDVSISEIIGQAKSSSGADKHIQISAHDQDLLDKYHALDDSGREMVDMTIEMQYKRVTQDKRGTGQRFA